MNKQHIKEQQRINAHRLINRQFSKATNNFQPIKYKQDREMARRKRQIECGQLKAENGLVV